MKIIIHGGFFSESSQSDDVKKAKQTALERIIKNSFVQRKPLFML
jgi:L-asparaginase